MLSFWTVGRIVWSVAGIMLVPVIITHRMQGRAVVTHQLVKIRNNFLHSQTRGRRKYGSTPPPAFFKPAGVSLSTIVVADEINRL